MSGGESNIRAEILLSNPPASGVEEIVISPYNAYSICNSLGNRLSIPNCTVYLTLFDLLAPTITAVSMTADTVVSVTASEGMFNNAFGAGAIHTEDFNVEFYSNNGNAADVQFINITNIGQDPLTGGETTVLIGYVTIGGSSSGTEEIAISPASSNSIFDPAGNPMAQTMLSERLSLPDRLPPQIVEESAEVSSDNSYVIFTLIEGVFGSSEIRTPVEPNDFTVEFFQNGGNATDAVVDYITNSRQFPVIGGEDTLRCYLEIQGLSLIHI